MIMEALFEKVADSHASYDQIISVKRETTAKQQDEMGCKLSDIKKIKAKLRPHSRYHRRRGRRMRSVIGMSKSRMIQERIKKSKTKGYDL